MFSRLYLIAATALFAVEVAAHTVITYPGWRGDNLVTNDTFPYGMQWMYPCEFEPFVRGFGFGFGFEREEERCGICGWDVKESAMGNETERNDKTKHFFSSYFQYGRISLSYLISSICFHFPTSISCS
jgi:hypothetical protein